MYKLSLTLHELPNALNVALRTNRFKSNNTNKNWDSLIYWNTLGKTPESPLQNARISLVRHSYRFLDYDGLVGSMKPVVDALVSAGVLIDDNWKVTGVWDVDQIFRPKKDGPLLEIEIEER